MEIESFASEGCERDGAVVTVTLDLEEEEAEAVRAALFSGEVVVPDREDAREAVLRAVGLGSTLR